MNNISPEVIVYINDSIRSLEKIESMISQSNEKISLTLDELKDIRFSLVNYRYSIKHKDLIYPHKDRVEVYLAQLNMLCEKLDNIVKEQGK